MAARIRSDGLEEPAVSVREAGFRKPASSSKHTQNCSDQ